MFLYLNPPRMLWSIPDTDVLMSRGSPFFELTEEIHDTLEVHQKAIIIAAIKASVLVEVSPEFVPKGMTQEGPDYILSRPAGEIHRKFISRMTFAKDLDGLKALMDRESESKSPRKRVLDVLEVSIKKLEEAGGSQYFDVEGSIDFIEVN